MLLICIILIIVFVFYFSSSKPKCPKSGSTDIAENENTGSPVETGLTAIIASLINPAGAQSYARRTGTTKYHRCRRCGHKF